jgi:putative methanogenesis marker protein 8
MEDEHIMETIGMTRVVIRNGKVVSVGTPKLSFCPLFYKYRDMHVIDSETVKRNIEQRISDYGLFTERRDLSQGTFVGFGTSEIFMSALHHGTLDAVVSACDGAGTVITAAPALVQGIGARLSGLVKTSPIPAVIERLESLGGTVLDPASARIDQAAGVKRAFEMGFERVGVTLVDPGEAATCKRIASPSEEVVTFLVHTSGITCDASDARWCDLVTACASRSVREHLADKALLQAGKSIPIFAMTAKGKELLLDRAKDVGRPMALYPASLPLLQGDQPEPLL